MSDGDLLKLFKALEVVVNSDNDINYKELLAAPTSRE